MENKKVIKQASIKSIPVLFGYIFLGIAYGVLMLQSGFNAWWTTLFSLTIYAGSLQFALVSLLTSNAAIILIAFTALLINFRHLFYGISFIDEFKKMGKKKWYMIFALSDETYSLLVDIKKDINLNDKNDRNIFFLISFLNHSYWVIGSLLGSLIGSLIPFNFEGIDFSMTALFIVILLNQFKDIKSFIPAFIGLGVSIIFLFVFGSDNFLLPSLIIVVLLIVLKNLFIKNKNDEDNTSNKATNGETYD